MNIQEAIEELKKNSWKYENRYFRYELVIDLEDAQEIVSQINEPKKVKIPQFVAEWIEKKKKSGIDLHKSMAYEVKVDVFRYIMDNSETYARAWLDGYEVEQEPKYRVMMVNPNSQGSQKIMLRRLDGGDSSIVWAKCKIANNRLQCHTKSELEQAGFGWVFDCEGVKVEEVK